MSGWFDRSMIPWGPEPFGALVLASSARSAVLLGAAAVAALLLRRRSAALRHLVWTVAIAGSLSLPIVSVVLPGWWVSLPWSGPAGREPGRPPALDQPESLANRPLEFAALARAARSQPEERIPESSPGHTLGVPARPVSSPSEVPLIDRIFSAVWNPSWALGVWVVGVLVSGVPVVLGMLSLRGVARDAAPVADPAMIRLARRLAARIGVRRPVRLVLSPRREIPMTWGILRPIILLPEDARGWPEERLATALLHELAHVRRGDCLAHLAARIACAVYWINPMAWLALARVRREQEQAADDMALQCGLDRHAYADHLLAIVAGRAVVGLRAAIATAMASSAKLERRLRGILDAKRSRREPGRRAIGLVTAGAAVLLLPLATLNPQAGAKAVAVPEPAAAGPAQAPQGQAQAQPAPAGVESEVLAKVREVSLKVPDESALRQGAIRGILEALHDPYSTYLDAQEMASLERYTQGTVTGIGAQLGLEDGQITVVTPLPDSPAIQAGIRPGDVVDAIDGKPARGLELAEVVKRIVGKEGTVVRLRVKHADGRTEDVAVTRGVVTIRSVRGFWFAGDRWDYFLDPEHAIAYAQLGQIAAGTPAELKAVIADLEGRGMKGLILDLRGCPGGLMNAAVACAQLFLSKGTIVTVRGRNEAVKTIAAQGPAATEVPLVLVIDGTTSSSAELLAGALKDNDRAVLVGSRTFGKGSIQTIVRLKDDGGALRLTTAYYQLPRGADIDKRAGKAGWGVDPTDGDYVPVAGPARDAWMRKRHQRERVGGPAPAAAPPRRATPESIERDEADPQLAAALKTLIARTTQGAFVKVGRPLAEPTTRLERLDEARKRRQALLDDLKKVDQELRELGQGAGERH